MNGSVVVFIKYSNTGKRKHSWNSSFEYSIIGLIRDNTVELFEECSHVNLHYTKSVECCETYEKSIVWLKGKYVTYHWPYFAITLDLAQGT